MSTTEIFSLSYYGEPYPLQCTVKIMVNMDAIESPTQRSKFDRFGDEQFVTSYCNMIRKMFTE